MNTIDDLQFIPVNSKKIPTVKEWQTTSKKHDLSKSGAVGLVCGKLSGGLEVIDVDCKYDLTGKLFENYKRLIHEVDKELLAKLVVQKTRSNGYHLIYRCSSISGNVKLANRPTTDEEKRQTYEQTYKAELINNPDDVKAKEVAEKASKTDKVRVLLETRGEGGYVVCFPSEGYELIHRDFYGIPEISIEERETLHNIARQFNQVLEDTPIPKKSNLAKTKGLSPFDDYNKRGDVISLLENHGWKIVQQKGNKTIFLRPGQTTAASSGNFDHDKNWFSVFTTSTDFDPQKAYLPYAVFATLECNKDFSETARKLLDLGFGDKDEPTAKEKAPSTRVIQSRINVTDDDFSFLATEDDYKQYMHQVRTGTLEMGKTTGMPSLDKHFLFKEGNLVMTNGIDNTGKSVFTWWLYLVAAMYHNWHGIIFSSENTIGSFMRKMIQFYWGKPLYGERRMSDNEYHEAKAFIEKHFKVIKAQEDLYNYKDIINMVKKAKNKYPESNFGMIDPYNSLKIDLSGFSKLSTHEYHYEALTEIKAFGQQNNFGWILNNHAVTSALRAKDAERKYPVAPRKEDTEGGGKFANKADDFFTVHRVTGHPTDWMVTEIHVRKIKDTETGGRATPYEEPVKFEMYKNQCAFIERGEGMFTPIDPIEAWHTGITPQPIVKQTDLYKNWIDKDSDDIGF
ncbi:MAG TPA: bifunctional DNA primase/polymerase [Chitinophagales bacterium]|nr:bifunctional DNA primase/polymerase [Chitinophagales bacterium]